MRSMRARMLDLAPGGIIAELQVLHHVGATHHRTAGHPTGDDLGQHRQVRRHTRQLLHAAGRPAEARYHFVEDEQGAVPAGRRAQPLEHPLPQWDGAPARAGRLQNHGGDVRVRGQRLLGEGHVINGRQHHTGAGVP